MREIGGDTWRIDNIVQCQISDDRAGLEEEGQWLLGKQLASGIHKY